MILQEKYIKRGKTMFKATKIFLAVYFLYSVVSISKLDAAVINAASCSQSDVQSAIDSAGSGDTVLVPGGSAAWSTMVTISKSITFKGAGMDQTVITLNTGEAIRVTGGTDMSFRITGFKFDGTSNCYGSPVVSLRSGTYKNFRIDHLTFLNCNSAITPYCFVEGLIDHCSYYMNYERGNPGFAGNYGDGEAAWKRPLGLGTGNALYIEDNYIAHHNSGSADRVNLATVSGARTVFRYNTAINGFIETFGMCDYNNPRGTVSYEIYENDFSGACFVSIGLKSGTGVVFNNTITGSFNEGMWLDDYRSCSATCQFGGLCDGTRAFDGNSAIETGTHTGSDSQATLTCSGKNWTPDEWVGYGVWNITDFSKGKITANTADTVTATLSEGYEEVESGTHTGSNDASILTDSSKSWSWSHWGRYGVYVWNTTDGSIGKVTYSTDNDITATLSGGTDNNWDTGDSYIITLVIPQTGVENDWDTGDSFKITDGYPCMDQIGYGGDVGSEKQPQIPEPLYGWGNTYNSSPLDLFVRSGCSFKAAHIQEGRDFYNGIQRPEYTPYTYPHPLQGVAPDTTPPDNIATVNDGPGIDIDSTFSTTQLQANWTAATDNESPVTNYHYAVGDTPGSTGVVEWTTLGNVLTVTKTGLTLTVGTTYYFSVKAQSTGGTCSATNSDGQFVKDSNDTTPPIDIATVNDGTGSDIDSTSSTTELSANWTESTDPDTGISRYDYAIGTTPGGINTVEWTSTSDGTVTAVTESGLSLVVGVTYYFTVKAVNGVGLESSPSNSDGQVVSGFDGIPPGISNVNAVNITRTTAVITWDTDEPATSRVEYGATASYGNSTSEDSDLVTGHSVNLTDLIPGIEYHYRVISKDSLSNEKISIDYTFKTPGDEIDAKVYPSPYSPSKGNSMRFSIDGTSGGEVKIYTLSGKLVKKLVLQSGESEVDWDVLNEEGNSITAGLYLYTITDGDGNKKTGKLAISH
jgi:hypothetical protein